MKRNHSFFVQVSLMLFLFVFVFAGNSYAKTHKKKSNQDPTPSPTASVTAQAPLPTATPAPRWTPPPPLDQVDRIIRYDVNAFYANDASGSRGSMLIDVDANRQLDEYNIVGHADVRFSKDFSTSDNSGETAEVRIAQLSYYEPWLQISLGKMDMGSFFSPMQFFGDYSMMGVRRPVGALVVVPISLSFGVVNEQNLSFKAPPTAFSFFWTPSLFSDQYFNLDDTQSFFIGQIHTRANIAGVNTTFRFDIGGSPNDYFHYSVVSGNLTMSLSAELNLDPITGLYGEVASQDTGEFMDSAVAGVGLRLTQLFTMGDFSLDEVNLEAQLPLATSDDNTFTGGNVIDPANAELPSTSWYAHIKARMKAIFIEGDFTNSIGNYTFGRLNQDMLSSPLPAPYGPVNETVGLRLPLLASSSIPFAFMVHTGVEF